MFKRIAPILIASLCLAGCGEEPGIERYEVTKPAGFSWPKSELREEEIEVDDFKWVWDVPAGWIDAPEVPDQLLADYRFKGATESLPGRVTVSKIDGEAGGINANVMRWLQQIYVTEANTLGPKDDVTGPMPTLDGFNLVTFADLHGQYQGEHMPTRIYAAILQITAPDGTIIQTWVFKLAGDDATVNTNREGLVQMAMTFRPKGFPRPNFPGLGNNEDVPDQTTEPTETP